MRNTKGVLHLHEDSNSNSHEGIKNTSIGDYLCNCGREYKCFFWFGFFYFISK